MDEMMEQQAQTAVQQAVGDREIDALLETLRKYKGGKRELDARIKSSENWWRLRNAEEAGKEGHGHHRGFKSKSGWLHNVIQAKHADAMDAYPEPNILPREPNDREEARILSAVVPCILEQNRFELTYSKTWFSKLKYGTGVYKVVWDGSKLGGLGDVSLLRCNLLTLFWEPGVEDIQDSRYFFEVNYYDEDAVREEYPQLADVPLPHDLVAEKFPEETTTGEASRKVPVISAYYHKGGLLHLCQFIPGHLLYATENDPQMAQTGIYAHGKYPYVFDALFPIEMSPAGYGYVDLCRQPQMEIDLMKSAMVENTKAGAKPRYFRSQGCGVNREQFLDLDNPIVDVEGSISELQLQPINHVPLDGNYLAFMQETVQELRETSGNSDSAAGTTPSGVTAASAIAALQEASGKTSRDAAATGYAAYRDVVELVIELVRQFYDAPRTFRIVGDDGSEDFQTYSNEGLQPQPLQNVDGMPDGTRLPVFDIKVEPQKRSAYTKMANNDLALQFYQLGFFNPQQADQSLACLSMMDFYGREDMIKTIRKNGTLFDLMQQLTQWAAAVCAKWQDGEAMMQLQMIMQQGGMAPDQTAMMQTPDGGGSVQGVANPGGEPTFMTNARQTARGATVPTEGGGAE